MSQDKNHKAPQAIGASGTPPPSKEKKPFWKVVAGIALLGFVLKRKD
jgi:hypothetical protein